MAKEKSSFTGSLLIAFGLIAVLWVVYVLQFYEVINTEAYGNWPQHLEGLKGIIFSPFIHGSFEHLISNTVPMLILLTVLLNAYPKAALTALVFIHVVSGTLVWLLAPDTGLHVGISGIIYGIAAFLVASGIFRKDRTSVTIAGFVVFIYGSLVLGFVPEHGVSWQSHLYGALSGVIIAWFLRKLDMPPPHEFELEEIEEEKHFFDPDNHRTEKVSENDMAQ